MDTQMGQAADTVAQLTGTAEVVDTVAEALAVELEGTGCPILELA